MRDRLLVVGLALSFLVAGAAVGPAAFTGGDEISEGVGVYLAPAETQNGESYAALEDEELVVSFEGMNREARTIVEDLVVIGVSDAAESADVWIDHDSPATFYRMDSGEPVESEANAVALGSGESIRLGVVVDGGAAGTILESIAVRANVSDTESTSTQGSVSSPPAETPTPTPIPTDRTESGSVRIDEWSVSTNQVRADEPLTVNATVRNTRSSPQTFTARLVHDDATVDSTTLRIPARSNRTITVEHVFEDPGRHHLGFRSAGTARIHVSDRTEERTSTYERSPTEASRGTPGNAMRPPTVPSASEPGNGTARQPSDSEAPMVPGTVLGSAGLLLVALLAAISTARRLR